MGYTHYITGGKVTPEIEADTKLILKATEVAIHNGLGVDSPTVNSENIILNGSEELGEDYETFVLSDNSGWNFCKTNHHPYDEVVVAILISLIRNGVGQVETDGSSLQDWAYGIDLYKKATGFDATELVRGYFGWEIPAPNSL